MVAFGGKGGALLAAVVGAVLALVAAPAMAAAIAQAVDVKPQANGVISGKSIVLSAKDDLFEGQTITTGSQGQVQIVFADDTHMVVGPGSTLVIEKYLMRNNGTASAFAVSALGGSFRFITGKSQKNAYKIDTPTGTIGVRGTKFDFKVTKKKTDIILFEGEVTYCPDAGGCKSVKGKCDVGSGEDSNAQVISNGSTNHSTDDFIYVKSQRSLNSDFKVNGAGACGAVAAVESRQEAAPDPGPDKPQGKPDPVPDPLPE